MIIEICLFCVCIFLFSGKNKLFTFLLNRFTILKKLKTFSGPTSYPFFGNSLLFFGKSNNDIFKTIVDITKGNKPVKIDLVIYNIVSLTNPEHIKLVLNSEKCLNKSTIYDTISNKCSLVTSDASKWRLHRKLLNPTMNIKMLQSFCLTFNNQTNDVIQNLSSLINDKTYIDVLPIFNALTAQITANTTFGHASKNEKIYDNYLEAINNGFIIIVKRILSPWLYSDIIFKKTKSYKIEQKWKKLANLYCKKISDSKRVDYNIKKELYSNLSLESNIKRPDILIDQLLKLLDENLIQNQDFLDHMEIFFLASIDTTAITLSNLIILLATHQEIQEKLYQEVNEVLHNNDNVEYEQLSAMNYLDMVIKETLRFLPTIPFVLRKCEVDLKIDDNYTLPQGVEAGINIYNLHRNPEVWGRDANKFNPDNFLPENIANRHPYSFLPFSGGPRNCIGGRYAIILLKIASSKLIKKFKFSTNINYNDVPVSFCLSKKLIEYFVKIEQRI